jgi:heterodisulfide reductase subunit B
MIITACPLCLYNLDANGIGRIPIFYFTELLARALDIRGVERETDEREFTHAC